MQSSQSVYQYFPPKISKVSLRLRRMNPKSTIAYYEKKHQSLQDSYMQNQSNQSINNKSLIQNESRIRSKSMYRTDYIPYKGKMQTRENFNLTMTDVKLGLDFQDKLSRTPNNFHKSYNSFRGHPIIKNDRFHQTQRFKFKHRTFHKPQRSALITQVERLTSALQTNLPFKKIIKKLYSKKFIEQQQKEDKNLKYRLPPIQYSTFQDGIDTFSKTQVVFEIDEVNETPKKRQEIQQRRIKRNRNTRLINSKLSKMIHNINQTKQFSLIDQQQQQFDEMQQMKQPQTVYFDREKVCAQLTIYSQYGKYKKKFPSMRDKTITALKQREIQIKRFKTFQKHEIQKKQISKFRYKEIKDDKNKLKNDFMKISAIKNDFMKISAIL